MGTTTSLSRGPTVNSSIRSISSLSPQDIHRGESFIDNHPWIRQFMPVFATFCLFTVLFGYSFLGAGVFQAMESGHELEELEKLNASKIVFRDWIMDVALEFKSLDYVDDYVKANYSKQIDIIVTQYEKMIKTKVCEGKLDLNGTSRWTFYGSLFLASTVITTIGYGHIAPVTTGGRIFCMAYAVFGISLLLLVLASIGSLLARGATLTYRLLNDKLGTLTIGKRKEKNKSNNDGTYSNRDTDVETPFPHNGTNSSEDQHREKVIDDIWGTIRFDKDGKMIISGDPSLSPNVPSSTTSPDKHTKEGMALQNKVTFDDTYPTYQSEVIRQPKANRNPLPVDSEDLEVERSIGFGVLDVDEYPEEVHIPLYIVFVLASIYIVILAATLLIWEEEWDFFDALYFSFVTLTTIGFGDLVPNHQKNLLACTFLIILGMAIISMCIALAQELIMKKIAWLSKQVGVALLSSKD